MGSLIGKLFGRSGAENEDHVLGCDMVPAQSVLSSLFETPSDDSQIAPAPSVAGGPFTTMAQAPIRDS